ncbi:hypothetical protein IAU60_006688 [Kwoniella sp. DSM 27419]
MTSQQSPSPDPLASSHVGSDGSEMADCIVVTKLSRKLAITPSKHNVARKRQPVVEIPTPRKKQKKEGGSALTTPQKPKTPGTGAARVASRTSPTPNGKGQSGPLPVARLDGTVTPTKKATPGRPTQKVKGTPTLAAGLADGLPTPSPAQSRKRPRTETPSVAKTLTFDDEVFEAPSRSLESAEITRQAFLANEALRRQREARNFEYKGEVDAPKLTRSGRIIRDDSVAISADTTDDLDEYGGVPEENDPLGPQAAIIPDVEVTVGDSDLPGVSPDEVEVQFELPPQARPFLKTILSTLTSRDVADNPPPFVHEDKNEALHGLVNLLKGTVERGEGNSALVVGPRGVGKTRTVARALNLLPSTSKTSPIVVRLSGHAQTIDRLAIREMGRQIAEAEGKVLTAADEEDEKDGENGEEYAPTTLPSHLLALLTSPSLRAIIIIIEEFDLFTEHARQALLYCLLDVVQSVKTGPVETTGRGVAVIGVTTRVDTLLLLEKRVKSRFSHRTWRIPSPLSPDGMGWKALLEHTLLPPTVGGQDESAAFIRWKDDWRFALEMLLESDLVVRRLNRLTGLTTDVRHLYRAFIDPVVDVIAGKADYLAVPDLADSVLLQIEGGGWGLENTKLKGLPHPALGVLIIAKHLTYAGREEFNFAQVEEEYLRFSRTKLVGSGKVRWPIGVLRMGYDHLLRLSLLIPSSNATVKPHFAKVRSTMSPHEVVAYFRGEGANVLGPEMGNWGRMLGGHA